MQVFEGYLRAIVDPEDADRRAKAAQTAPIESHGGPQEVMCNLITMKNDTPVPTEVEANL